MGAAGSGLLLAGLLWAAAAGPDGSVEHVVAEVLSCQPQAPTRALAVAFDADPLFWFDFPGARWTPGLPQGPPWPQDLETPRQLLVDTKLCQDLLRNLGRAAAGILPEAKGVPVVSVFPLRPPALGEPATLVCLVENIFPPAVEISWRRDGVPVTAGVTRTPYTPTGDGAFVRFSHLAATPRAGHVYACVVTHDGGNASVVTYWVAQSVTASDELGTALSGAAAALGALLALAGAAMLVSARRDASG